MPKGLKHLQHMQITLKPASKTNIYNCRSISEKLDSCKQGCESICEKSENNFKCLKGRALQSTKSPKRGFVKHKKKV